MRAADRCPRPGRRWLLLLIPLVLGGCKSSKGAAGPTAPAPATTLTAAPPVLTPANGAQVGTRPELRVQNVAEGGAEDRTYQFQLAENPEYTGGTFAIVTEDPGGTTVYRVETPLLVETTYYWRARFRHAGMVGPFTETSSFTTRPNAAPVIASLTATSDRAEVGVPLRLTAVVEDESTPIADLAFEWTAPAGVFKGTGRTVTWTGQPAEVTPATHDLTLTVIETFDVRNPDGTAETRENRVSASVTIHVNASAAELTALVDTFLADFSNSSVPPDVVVRNFSDNCGGKVAELDEIAINRATFLITSSRFRSPASGSTRRGRGRPSRRRASSRRACWRPVRPMRPWACARSLPSTSRTDGSSAPVSSSDPGAAGRPPSTTLLDPQLHRL